MESVGGSDGGDFGWFGYTGLSGPLDKWMEEILASALVEQGCPPDSTQPFLRFATLVRHPDAPWRLDVFGHLYLANEIDVSRTEFAHAALDVAEMIRDSNAEAVVRRRRGEDGPPPYWDIPDSPELPPSPA